jgi:hypothetical protein
MEYKKLIRVPKYTCKKTTVLEKGQKSTMFIETSGQARIEEWKYEANFLVGN